MPLKGAENMINRARAELGIARALHMLSTLAIEGRLEEPHPDADYGTSIGESWYASLVLWSHQLETAEE